MVWELSYSDKVAVKGLIQLMNMMFPKGHPALKKLVLLVNNGIGGTFEVFLIAAFLTEHWPDVSDEINSIPGVTQTFIWAPENLLTLATQGQYYIAASNVTPKDVDRLYAKGK